MYITISSFKPLLNHMYSNILTIKEDNTWLTRDINKNVSTYTEKNCEWLETNELLDLAAFLIIHSR